LAAETAFTSGEHALAWMRMAGGGWAMTRAGLAVVAACFAVCAALLPGGGSKAEDDSFAPFERHMGEFGCGSWPSAESFERLPKAALLNWILGYLSRAAFADHADLLATVDQSSASAWMDNYCQAHPLDTVAQGAYALEQDLRSRAAPAR
jgi:hypothetical protein